MTEPANSLDEWTRAQDARESISRLENLVARARVQLLSDDALLRELRNGSSPLPLSEMLERLAAVSLSEAQTEGLQQFIIELVEESRPLKADAQKRYDRVLARLLPKLSQSQALAVVRPFTDDSRKSRRDVAYRVFRWAAIDADIANRLLARYQRTGDERALKVLVAAEGAAHAANLLPFLRVFTDRYWKMRTLQAIVKAELPLADSVIREYPTEYVQAVTRVGSKTCIPHLKRLRHRKQFQNDPTFLAFYGWAMYELGEFEEVSGLQRKLSQLRSRTEPRA